MPWRALWFAVWLDSPDALAERRVAAAATDQSRSGSGVRAGMPSRWRQRKTVRSLTPSRSPMWASDRPRAAIARSAILETVRTGASGIGRGERVLRV